MKFQNKVAVVTGGGQGIGRAICQVFASEGAQVLIADYDDDAGIENERYILEQGYAAHFIRTDISEEESVKKMADKAVEKFGTIDILVNNAGIARASHGNLFDTPMELWDKVVSVNLRGTYMCAKYCGRIMAENKKGCIINIASTRAFMSEPDTEAYSASKGGVIALTHSLAVSLGKYGIRVNSISPGWIDVSEWKKSSDARTAVLTEEDNSQHPAGRVGNPYDIARACTYLSSDDAGFITGTNLTVDGGMTIKMIYV